MDDLISRQAAIDAFWKLDVEIRPSAINAIIDMIRTLPPAETPKRTGKSAQNVPNDDLIFRKAAIKAVDATWWNARGIRKTIQELPSAQQWIPCSERLPEESGRYLVTRGLNACGSLWNRVYIANYSDLMGIKSERIWWQGNVGKPDFERLDDVLAWMPLPEPYKGEES